jgi:DNA-binding LytR/AlgR family response regulator
MNIAEKLDSISIGGRKIVCPDDIIMIQADINYSIVYLNDGNRLIVATTLKKLEERFSPFAFIRVNKTYVVNSRYVVEEQENALKLSNSLIISFSRRKAKKWKSREE